MYDNFKWDGVRQTYLYLRLYDFATVCTGVAKHFVVMVLAVRSPVIGSNKVRIVHERFFAVRTDEVLRMPRLKQSVHNQYALRWVQFRLIIAFRMHLK